MRLLSILSLCVLSLSLFCGCNKTESQAKQEPPKRAPHGPSVVVPADFVLKSAPADAKDLAAVRASAKDGEEITINAVVGGTVEPFTADHAVMQVMDPSIPTCDKMGMDKNACATPWDACCHQPDVKKKNATVRVVNAEGKPLAGTLEGVGGVAPGKTVVVKGKAHVDGETLTIDATNLFVKG